MSDFNSLVQYTVENISRPVKYIIYKLTEFIRVVDKFVFRQLPAGAASGYATIEQIEGNTVKFNQLSPFTTSRWSIRNAGGTAVFDAEGYLTLTNLSSSTTGNCVGISNPFTPNHICYIKLDYIVGNLDTLNRALCVGWSDSPFYYNGKINVIAVLNGSALSGSLSAISTVHATWNYFIIMPRAITNTTTLKYRVNIHDLTLIFGAGNEPSTVADFEAWMAQNIGTLPYYDYNAGELLSVKMSGMQTDDSSQQTIDTLPFDVTTITGINTSTNVREVIFPNGMNWLSDSVHDEIDFVNGTATVKCGIVDLGDGNWNYDSTYQLFSCRYLIYSKTKNTDKLLCIKYLPYTTSSLTMPDKTIGVFNANDALYVKDTAYTDPTVFKNAMNGVKLIYELATPITYTDLQDGNGNPLNPRYKVEQGGTEQVLPVNTSTPTTVAPTLTTTYTKDNN